jgi:hypothetical protein
MNILNPETCRRLAAAYQLATGLSQHAPRMSLELRVTHLTPHAAVQIKLPDAAGSLYTIGTRTDGVGAESPAAVLRAIADVFENAERYGVVDIEGNPLLPREPRET